MLLSPKVVYVPAQREIDADLGEYGFIGGKCKAAYGNAAIEAGAADFGRQDERTDAVDAIANILHYVGQYENGGRGMTEEQARGVLDSALMHYLAEIQQ